MILMARYLRSYRIVADIADEANKIRWKYLTDV